jgi:hypothetical protein
MLILAHKSAELRTAVLWACLRIVEHKPGRDGCTKLNDAKAPVDSTVDPKHLDDSDVEEYSASYRGKAFQTMEGIAIYHDSQVPGITLRNLKKIRFIYSVKLIKG